MMHMYINNNILISESHINRHRVKCSLEDGLSFSILVPNFPIANPNTNIQSLSTCKIKIVLHIKGATKTAYRTKGFCKLKTHFSVVFILL